MGRRGFALGGGSFLQDPTGRGAPTHVLAVLDLDAATPRADCITLPFLPHGVAVDPRDGCRAVVFEKKGPGAAVVDLYRPRSVVRSIETEERRHFYGHGAFSRDGALLYATESKLDQAFAGVLIVRDARTFEQLGEVPTGGAAPHDCALIDEGRTLVVTNGGGPFAEGAAGRGSVSYVDVGSGKIVEQVTIEDDRFNAGHFATSPRGDLAVVSAPRDALPTALPSLGALTLRPAGAGAGAGAGAERPAARTMTEPRAVVERMRGETLSVLLDEARDTVLATHPLGDCVSVWRMSSGTHLRTLELPNPRGVARTLDDSAYVISYATRGLPQLALLDPVSFAPLGPPIAPSFTSGSHLYIEAL